MAAVENEWIGRSSRAFVTGQVDQELLARNDYLAAENRILKAQLKGPLSIVQKRSACAGLG